MTRSVIHIQSPSFAVFPRNCRQYASCNKSTAKVLVPCPEKISFFSLARWREVRRKVRPAVCNGHLPSATTVVSVCNRTCKGVELRRTLPGIYASHRIPRPQQLTCKLERRARFPDESLAASRPVWCCWLRRCGARRLSDGGRTGEQQVRQLEPAQSTGTDVV